MTYSKCMIIEQAKAKTPTTSLANFTTYNIDHPIPIQLAQAQSYTTPTSLPNNHRVWYRGGETLWFSPKLILSPLPSPTLLTENKIKLMTSLNAILSEFFQIKVIASSYSPCPLSHCCQWNLTARNASSIILKCIQDMFPPLL